MMWRKVSAWSAAALLAGTLVVMYVLSSWYDYGYGCTLGSRVMVDYYTLLAVPMAMLLAHVKWMNLLIVPFGLFCIYLSVFQSWQYTHFVLHWAEMNEDKYWLVFLESGDQYRGAIWKPEVFRPWAEKDMYQEAKVEVAPYVCDTLYKRAIGDSELVKPSLLLVGFEYGRDYWGEDPAAIDVSVLDSTGLKALYYRRTYVFHYRERDKDRHGSYFYELPPITGSGPLTLLVRVFTNENVVVLNRLEVKFYHWQD
jgi:hypothetical protein